MTCLYVSFRVLQVKCVVETRDGAHADELERLLRRHYDHVVFGEKAY